MKSTTTDVRKSLQANLERQRAIAGKLENLPELKAAELEHREAHQAWMSDPKRGINTEDKNRSLELHTNMVRAIEAVRNIEGPGNEAKREIRRLESLLNAGTDAERLKKELAAVTADGTTTEKRVVALRGVVDAITEQRAQAEAKATAERTEAADRAIDARLEGKAVAPAKTAGAAAAELASLDAELAAAQRQLGAATEKLGALGERANGLRHDLLRAMSRIAEVEYTQALEDIRPIAEHYAAINLVANTTPSDLAIAIDETAVRRLVNELDAQHRGWQPTAQAVRPMPANAGERQGAEPGAQAAA